MTPISTIKKCLWCDKTKGVIKFYVAADDFERPKPYHPACARKLSGVNCSGIKI